MAENWIPPTRENWELVVYCFQFFPLVTIFQWVQPWYGAGKTSGNSRLNLPGRWAWITMEIPGFLTLLYVMNTLPAQLGIAQLPWENKVLGALFVIHYLYRAILAPLIAPSMSPIHLIVWASAVFFQIINGLSIGSWLAGYGIPGHFDGQDHMDGKTRARMLLGMAIWVLGFAGNIWHDDELREIRRAVMRKQKKETETTGKSRGVDKVYMIPQNGLFRWIFYPHYLLEWVEWAGFWLMAGVDCVPARNFLLNEITTMLPRAVQGKRWYVERFGEEKVGGRKAIIPGFL